ncbi:dTDP-glucose 4,6-dehydratase, partial [Jeotgalibaca dankookensis]
DGYFTEETPLAPNSPYSASKASADMLVHSYYETFGMNVNITRCSNNYGPYHFPEKLIPLMITNAMDGKPLPIYGDGLNVRDWLHVKDHCQAIDLVLRKGKKGEVYNVGGHNERTNNEIVDIIVDYLGVSRDLITYVDDRLGHDHRYAIDPTKLETELGWQPEYTFDTGIIETIEWYLNREDWWRPLKERAELTGGN